MIVYIGQVVTFGVLHGQNVFLFNMYFNPCLRVPFCG